MALTTLTNTVNVQPSGSTAGAVVGFTLDDSTPLTSQSASFVTDDEKVIAGDLHGINQGSQIFGVGGYTEEDLTVHSAPLTVNEANFDTPGLGITTQMLAISDHAQFISCQRIVNFVRTVIVRDDLQPFLVHAVQHYITSAHQKKN